MQRLYRMLPPLNLTMAVLAIAAASFASATEEASERERLEADSAPTEDRSRLESSATLLDRPTPPRSPASAREPDDIATRLHREGRFMSGASDIAEATGDPHRFLPGGHYSQGPLLDPEALVPLDMTPGPALRSPGGEIGRAHV